MLLGLKLKKENPPASVSQSVAMPSSSAATQGHGVLWAQAANEGHFRVWIDTWGTCCHQAPRGCPDSDQPPESRLVAKGQDASRSECPVHEVMVMSGPELQLKAMSGSVGLLQPGSALISNVPATIEGHADTRDRGHVGVSGPYFRWGSGDIQTQPL